MGIGVASLNTKITACNRCDRLIDYCKDVSTRKKRMYLDNEYWGKPVPSFGDPNAEILIVGLAPAAHGANRTGRMFTGDRSGSWLFEALHQFGFANQSESYNREDGLILDNVYITAVVHCAPPQNKPSLEEIGNCNLYLQEEIKLLSNVKVVIALGRIAFDNYIKALKNLGYNWTADDEKPIFGHNLDYRTSDGKFLVSSFHPSQQNTQTGRLTRDMFHGVFEKVRRILTN